ncbi:MAG: M42 family metallopeptidase [Clostridium sp.]|uniref:M42 family metallopeptidase n=1 Tax=Clostridium sp. TaxID=1506 RepID=UPI003F36D153
MKLSDYTVELMKELTQVVGVSGNEKHISKALQTHYKKYTDEIIFDNLGSLFAVKKSNKKDAKKVMISAHMDEVGFIVHEIEANGLIKILQVGPIWEQSLIASRVKVVNYNGEEIEGVIVSKPKLLINDSDKGKVVNVNNMYVDIGTSSKEEVENLGIELGDSIVVNGEFEILNGEKRIVSKAWDNRYGCILGIEILKDLKDVELDFDLYVGCTVQNEVGLRGCITATNLIKPDLSIVLDCLSADDLNGSDDSTGKLGEGVLVSYYDKSMMPNRALLNHLVDVCEENNIKHQFYYSMDDGDAGWIHKLQEGCPTLKGCICARNSKTSSEIIDIDDYISARFAITEIIKNLNEEAIEKFKMENR